MSPITLTLDQAQRIVTVHVFPAASISSFAEVSNDSYSYTTSTKAYFIQIKPESISASESQSPLPTSYILLISRPPAQTSPSSPDPSLSLPLATIHKLLTSISTSTSIRLPSIRAIDTSLTDKEIPYHWLLLDVPALPPQPSSADYYALIDVQLGIYLKELHGVQNEYFGVPDSPYSSTDTSTTPSFSIPGFTGAEGADGFNFDEDLTQYSWQDTFTLLLDTLLDELSTSSQSDITKYVPDIQAHIPAIRAHLARAMGSFLFDDVEMPSLLWVTGAEEDVFVVVPRAMMDQLQPEFDELSSSSHFDPSVAYILPTFTHALWGDPLLEALFMPPRPSWPFAQGYTRESINVNDELTNLAATVSEDSSLGVVDNPLIVFPRQRTKRIWYTLYLALLVLYEHTREDAGQGELASECSCHTKLAWASDTVPRCVEALKEAPCY
ncbi:hypothetical protein SERLA73DRAFT_77810 [Serpula lacrymans var. lacrymans S7.3]|uniref:Aminoglycoside phosphotransferase domain-containing protein n=1 Tax=Serpula lacrymans var. lacrymans (strain S7.3) TaxID=936435 RepID=F8QB26_SERL3|nr:hypothetical protein SERLA73DRAFT_77810 [Serpula lacrymans var. lacrymans S7.3]